RDVGEFDRLDRMGARVAGHDEPRPATAGVMPQLAMPAGRIVAQIDVGVERCGGVGPRRIRSPRRRVAEIAELLAAALAAIGTTDPQRSLLNAGSVGRRRRARRSWPRSR